MRRESQSAINDQIPEIRGRAHKRQIIETGEPISGNRKADDDRK